MNRRRLGMAISIVAVSLLATAPSGAQWIVFDPNNYVQNVLTAARELQQINNQITSLQNEAQMLINQAKTWQACHIPRCSSSRARFNAPSSFSARPSASAMTCSRSIGPSPPATDRQPHANPIQR